MSLTGTKKRIQDHWRLYSIQFNSNLIQTDIQTNKLQKFSNSQPWANFLVFIGHVSHVSGPELVFFWAPVIAFQKLRTLIKKKAYHQQHFIPLCFSMSIHCQSFSHFLSPLVLNWRFLVGIFRRFVTRDWEAPFLDPQLRGAVLWPLTRDGEALKLSRLSSLTLTRKDGRRTY